MTICRKFTVSGRVQGVGFRYAACDEARRLAITGWVRNLPSGDVEAVACGEPEPVLAFEQWLRRGPRAARVTHVDGVDAPVERFEGFDVR